MSRFDQLVVRYTKAIIRFRWLVLLASLVAVVATGAGMKNITFDKSYRVFFDDDNPQLQSFDALQSIYSRSDNLLLVVAPEDGNVFTNETLAAVADINDDYDNDNDRSEDGDVDDDDDDHHHHHGEYLRELLAVIEVNYMDISFEA